MQSCCGQVECKTNTRIRDYQQCCIEEQRTVKEQAGNERAVLRDDETRTVGILRTESAEEDQERLGENLNNAEEKKDNNINCEYMQIAWT